MEFRDSDSARTYHILGVPLRSGSWTPGNEQGPQAYRDVQLFEALTAANVRARDEGDLAVPSYLPHHTVPPIRNWPGSAHCVGTPARAADAASAAARPRPAAHWLRLQHHRGECAGAGTERRA
jgi:hypothetical protein